MSEDPSIKDAVQAAKRASKRVSSAAWNAKIPIQKVSNFLKFLVLNWIIISISAAATVGLFFHYGKELNSTYCNNIYLEKHISKVQKYSKLEGTLLLSPLYQWPKEQLIRMGGSPTEFDPLVWMKAQPDNMMGIFGFESFVSLTNEEQANRMLTFKREQKAAACAARYGDTAFLVVLGHGIATLMLLMLLFRRRLP